MHPSQATQRDPKGRWQFKLQTLLLVTAAFAVFYAVLGYTRHEGVVILWIGCLLLGPPWGIVIGLKRYRSEPLIGAVRGGTLGSVAALGISYILSLPIILTEEDGAELSRSILIVWMALFVIYVGAAAMLGAFIGSILILAEWVKTIENNRQEDERSDRMDKN